MTHIPIGVGTTFEDSQGDQTSPGHLKTFCPECGFGVSVDEDGLCVHCGATAVGKAIDELFK